MSALFVGGIMHGSRVDATATKRYIMVNWWGLAIKYERVCANLKGRPVCYYRFMY